VNPTLLTLLSGIVLLLVFVLVWWALRRARRGATGESPPSEHRPPSGATGAP
jgi:hypothetical protein